MTHLLPDGTRGPHPHASKGPRVSWRVPKAALIEALARPFRNEHLKIARGLRWGPALAEELRTFRRTVNPKTAHVKLEHASGKHDDLVLAAALSAWRLDTGVSAPPPHTGVPDYQTRACLSEHPERK
jgi:hypothetical protein